MTRNASDETGVAPPLNYRHRRLSNGLDVYTMKDSDTGSVSVQVWYRVGSKDDPAGRSGFAHLFEHMMFKATRQMPPEYIDRLTEDVGGFNNASTYDDFTNYYEVAPANHLRRLLWAEASRMGSLIVNEEAFTAERDVVKEELRERIFAAPYGRLFYNYLAQANYAVHPYGRPGIGSIEELDQATLGDVRAFHRAFYRPDNAILVVSGCFDDTDVDEAIDTYFAPIATPANPVPRRPVTEPARQHTRTIKTAAPNVPLPAVTLSFSGIRADAANLAALSALDAILSRGDSSRLYKGLVYETAVASEVFTIMEATLDPSVYTLGAILSDGVSAETGAAALRAEVDKIVSGGVTEEELVEARNEILSEKVEARETAFGRGFELADAVMRFGDPRRADALLRELTFLTTADIQHAATTLFTEQVPVSSILYTDDQDPYAGDDTIDTPDTIVALPLGALSSSDEETPAVPQPTLPDNAPPPGPARAVRLPLWTEKTLTNGLRVVFAGKPGTRVVNGILRFPAGGGNDAPSRCGLADQAASLTLRGAGSHSAMDLASAIEQIGATVAPGADKDTSYASFFTRSDNLGEALGLFADTVLRPHFDTGELDRQRRNALDDLSVSLSEPSYIASRALTQALFGREGYGAPVTSASLAAITRDDIADFHKRHWRPEGGVFTLVGDIDPDAAFSLLEAHFADWHGASHTAALIPAKPAERSITLIDMPGAGQAAVYAGYTGPTHRDPDFLAAALATAVLGGGYSARLNMEIRVKRGLSYGASANFAARKFGGAVVAATQTRNDAAADIVEIFETQFRGLADNPPTLEELTARKATLTGQLARDVETSGGLCDRLSSLAACDRPLEQLSTFSDDIDGVSTDHILQAVDRYFTNGPFNAVIVGDADEIAPRLARYAPDFIQLSLIDSGSGGDI